MKTNSSLRRAYSSLASRPNVWRLVLIGGLIASVSSPFLTNDTGRELLQFVFGLSTTIVALATARRSSSRQRTTWYLFAASILCFFLGNTILGIYQGILHLTVPFPSIADIFFVSAYPFIFLALRSMFAIDERNGASADILDSAVVALGALAILWPTLIAPYLSSPSIGTFGVTVNVLYPLMDLVLIFLTVRYMVFARSTVVSRSLILMATTAMFVSDFMFDWISSNGDLSWLRFIGGGYLLEYTLICCAALRVLVFRGDEIDHIDQPKKDYPEYQPSRIPILLVSGLIPAGVYCFCFIINKRVDTIVLAGISSAIFMLIGLRLKLLFGRITEQSMTLHQSLEELITSNDERTGLEVQLRHQAFHDHLTQLPNRAQFENRVNFAQSQLDRNGGFNAVILIDLDDFKTLNDTLGHAIGDAMLVAVSERLSSRVRETDAIFRLGGDEFGYLAEGLKTRDEAEFIVARLLSAFVEPFPIGGLALDQRASAGWHYWDESLLQPGEALECADLALYESKKTGAGRSSVFAPELKARAVGRFTLLQDLRQALKSGQLSMYFQPIVDLHLDTIVGFESLMRWRHPTRGWVPPDEFIPAAEQSDLIHELGRFALFEAVAAACSWSSPGSVDPVPFVTVNLSARQFQDQQLIADITRAITQHGLQASRLVLEITEGVAMENPTETRRLFEQLNQLGISVALDDFGTGHSSLSTLVDFMPKIIKVDQSFIRPANESIQNDAILESVISLGHKLKMIVLAEGVETLSKAEMLALNGCDLGQGYLWSPAIPAHEIPALLARHSRIFSEETPVN